MKKLLLGLFTISFLFLSSCQKDDNNEINSEQSKIKRNVKISELPHLKNALQNNNKIENLYKNGINYFDFINYDNITIITQSDSTKTYTFALNINESDKLLNLVISESNSGYQYNLVEYSSSQIEEWKESINNHQQTNINANINITNIDNSTSKSSDCYYSGWVCPSGQHHQDGFSFCIYPVMDWTYGVYAIPCDDSGGGGSGGTNPPTSEQPPFTEPVFPTLSPAIVNFIMNLTPPQKTWWNSSDITIKNEILFYLNQNIQNNVINPEAIAFVKWGINYLINNPSVTWEQFKNWFFGNVEGKDSFYNGVYWQNPSLNFPQQQLPTWINFNNSMPRNANGTLMAGADNVFSHVGGAVLQARIDNPNTTNNTCALKISIALNGAGITIPNISGQTLQGGGAFAGKYFFLNAKALNNWMKLTFGVNPTNPNHHLFTESQGGQNGQNFPILLNSLTPNHGIFTMLPMSAIEFGASGHCDIFDGTNCATNCYFDSASEVNIWILP